LQTHYFARLIIIPPSIPTGERNWQNKIYDN
jgi:hypothetical protein